MTDIDPDDDIELPEVESSTIHIPDGDGGTVYIEGERCAYCTNDADGVLTRELSDGSLDHSPVCETCRDSKQRFDSLDEATFHDFK